MPYETHDLEHGYGCFSVVPTALTGTVLILDYPGPPSPFGGLEFFGWWALCLAVAWASSPLLIRRRRHDGHSRLSTIILGLGLPVLFAFLTYADAHPDTPEYVKLVVEYALQLLGVPSLVLLIGFPLWSMWRLPRS